MRVGLNGPARSPAGLLETARMEIGYSDGHVGDQGIEGAELQGTLSAFSCEITVPHQCMDDRAVPQRHHIGAADRQGPLKYLECGLVIGIVEPDYQSGRPERGRIIAPRRSTGMAHRSLTIRLVQTMAAEPDLEASRNVRVRRR